MCIMLVIMSITLNHDSQQTFPPPLKLPVHLVVGLSHKGEEMHVDAVDQQHAHGLEHPD